jgi:ketosteroid isomerase-like protein
MAVSEQTTASRVLEALDAYARKDMDVYRSYFADGVIWHVGGSHEFSGDYEGLGSLFDYFARVDEMTEGSLQLDVQEVLANERRCMVFARVNGERKGKKLDVNLAQAFAFDADGKFAEYWALADDQASVDAFWS